MAIAKLEFLSRRASFGVLTSAGLSGLWARPAGVTAKASTSKKARKKCQRQEAACVSGFSARCAGNTAATCLAQVQQCCSFTATCDVGGFLSCTILADSTVETI